MRGLELQTPLWALVALVAAAPLAAVVVAERRAARVRTLLGLAAPRRSAALVPAAAIALLGALVGTAAAQPVVVERERADARRDAQALFVLDVSRSMLAAPAPGAPTRFERARAVARELRAAVPEVPAGVVSITDRVLPHLFPTHDPEPFDATVERALEAGAVVPMLGGGGRATSFQPLPELASRGYFAEEVERRAVVVVTDGESLELDAARLADELADAPPLDVLFVHVAAPGERVFLPDGRPEPYRTDPGSRADLESVAAAVGGEVVGEAGPAASRLRALLGRGRVVEAAERRGTHALGPYVLALGLLPVGLLLARRNRA